MQATGVDRLGSPAADLAFLARVEELRRGIEAVQGKVWAQDEVLARLQEEASSLEAGYRGLRERAAAALEALRACVPPAPARAMQVVPLQREPVPALVGPLPSLPRETSFYSDAPARVRSPRLWLPYAALALAGLAISVLLPRVYVRQGPAVPTMPAPAPLRAVMPIDFSSGQTGSSLEGAVSIEQTDAVMRLVDSYRPAGSARTMGELLHGSPWLVQATDSGRFLVTVRPDGAASGAPVYEFEVDPARGLVQPSQETLAGLAGGTRLAARD